MPSSAHFPFSRYVPRYISIVPLRSRPNTGIIETSVSPVVRKFSRFRLTDALCITPGESLGHDYFTRHVQSSKLGSTLVSNNPSCNAPSTIRIAYSACRLTSKYRSRDTVVLISLAVSFRSFQDRRERINKKEREGTGSENNGGRETKYRRLCIRAQRENERENVSWVIENLCPIAT